MDKSQCPPSPGRLQAYSGHSNISEVDSLSDSDWLDIASNRESDDNDSVFSSRDADHEESDFPPSSLTRSRRSSVSFDESSRDGDIDAWEGFVEEGADKSTHDEPAADLPAVPPPPAVESVGHVPASEGDVLEDQRVKDGLDQSMISTLSASRSSSLQASTLHSSSGDLRLSFPDPITSPRGDLDISYEDVQPHSSASCSVPDSAAVAASWKRVDPGSSHTPEVFVPLIFADKSPAFVSSDFYIVLYGVSSAIKWPMVEILLEKVAIGAGVRFTPSIQDLDGSNQQVVIMSKDDPALNALPHAISVIDATQSAFAPKENSSANFQIDCPSLAIVFMPTLREFSADHTFYLPILATSAFTSSFMEADDAILRTAQQSWEVFNIPKSKVLPISEDTQTEVIREHDLANLSPSQASHMFELIVSRGRKKPFKASRDPHNPVHIMTIFTLVSLVIGVVVSSTLPAREHVLVAPPVTTTSAAYSPSSFWDILRPAINHSSLQIVQVDSAAAVAPSSLKEFALSIFQPATSMSATMCPSIGPTADCRSTRLASWAERLKSSTDLILRPNPSISSVDTHSKALSVIPQTSTIIKRHVEPSATLSATTSVSVPSFALGLTLPKALSRTVDLQMSALLSAVQTDLQDILDALDELVQAIAHHANYIVSQSSALIKHPLALAESSVQAVKEELRGRHIRARKRAKEIKEFGKYWAVEAGELLRKRVGRAKGKAREIAQTLGVDHLRANWVARREKGDRERANDHARADTQVRIPCRGERRDMRMSVFPHRDLEDRINKQYRWTQSERVETDKEMLTPRQRHTGRRNRRRLGRVGI